MAKIEVVMLDQNIGNPRPSRNLYSVDMRIRGRIVRNEVMQPVVSDRNIVRFDPDTVLSVTDVTALDDRAIAAHNTDAGAYKSAVLDSAVSASNKDATGLAIAYRYIVIRNFDSAADIARVYNLSVEACGEVATDRRERRANRHASC